MKSDESKYGTSDIYFSEERKIIFNSEEFHGVTKQSYDNTDLPLFPCLTSIMDRSIVLRPQSLQFSER